MDRIAPITTHWLVPASIGDQHWLEHLRRAAYRDLFDATFGGWDEGKHSRQFAECWQRGSILLIKAAGSQVGMIQVFDSEDALQIGELQIHPEHQNRGVGSRLLEEVRTGAHRRGKAVRLSVGKKNDGAFRLYRRLGFRLDYETDTHFHLVSSPGTRTTPQLPS
jgi:ribosomal protein S18 acetylase RimI-like enzyme